MCSSLINGKEFDTKEEAEEHIAKKEWDDILTSALIFILHVNNELKKHSNKISHEKNIRRRQNPKRKQNGGISA